jgi:NADPH-dependent ferric siderophore reductase
MRPATLTAVEELPGAFRQLTLVCATPVGVASSAGQKIRLALWSSLDLRTYTPFGWDEGGRAFKIVAYVGGTGPGAEWLAGASAGAQCSVFGPQPSLALPEAARIIVMCGDETSVGLSVAAERDPRRAPIHHIIEADADLSPTFARLGLSNASWERRGSGDGHLHAIARRLGAYVQEGASFVLTGRAASIQRLNTALRSAGAPPASIQTKAYWAAGKVGLD